MNLVIDSIFLFLNQTANYWLIKSLKIQSIIYLFELFIGIGIGYKKKTIKTDQELKSHSSRGVYSNVKPIYSSVFHFQLAFINHCNFMSIIIGLTGYFY